MHWFPKYLEASLIILGFLIAAEFIETLSAPALSNACMFSIDEIPPPTVRGIKTSFAVYFTTLIIVSLFSNDALISKKHISSAPLSE